MRKYMFWLAFPLASPLSAQTGPSLATVEDRGRPDTTITVTATGTRSEVEDTGQAVTVIGEAEIERVQGADLTSVLERVPGLTYTRNGGLGGLTSVRLRGAEGEQTLVVLDGVRMADQAAPGGGFDFGNLLAGNLEKIEILRGSNSTSCGRPIC